MRAQPELRLFRQRTWFQRINNYSAIWQNIQSGHIFFEKELKRLLRCDEAWLRTTAREYLSHPQAWQHLSTLRSPSQRMDGFAKSLDVAEGFALWALVKMLKPKVVVELGVNRAISSRLWKEALDTYVPQAQLVLCDLVDKRVFIDDHEARFIQADAFESLPVLFREHSVDILHNDAHPYDLIRWSVLEAFKHDVPCLTFHDVGSGRRGPFRLESSKLSEEERIAHRVDWAQYGTWERHVMSELLAPSLLSDDYAKTAEWECQIFDSLFGLGVALRRPAQP